MRIHSAQQLIRGSSLCAVSDTQSKLRPQTQTGSQTLFDRRRAASKPSGHEASSLISNYYYKLNCDRLTTLKSQNHKMCLTGRVLLILTAPPRTHRDSKAAAIFDDVRVRTCCSPPQSFTPHMKEPSVTKFHFEIKLMILL